MNKDIVDVKSNSEESKGAQEVKSPITKTDGKTDERKAKGGFFSKLKGSSEKTKSIDKSNGAGSPSKDYLQGGPVSFPKDSSEDKEADAQEVLQIADKDVKQDNAVESPEKVEEQKAVNVESAEKVEEQTNKDKSADKPPIGNITPVQKKKGLLGRNKTPKKRQHESFDITLQ